MTLAALRALFAQRIGIKESGNSDQELERLLNERMGSCGIDSLEEYYRHLVLSSDEFQELVEALAPPSTWFFRERHACAFFLDYYRNRWHQRRQLEVLLLPGGTGEEAYSLVIAMAEAGERLDGVQIHAVDISGRAVVAAQQGIYSDDALHEVDEGVRRRHFEKLGDGFHQIASELRCCVDFSCDNYMAPRAALLSKRYDLILCHHLLPQLHEEAQKQTEALLFDLLNPGGGLVTSPTDAGGIVGHKPECDCLDVAYFRNGGSVLIEEDKRASASRVALLLFRLYHQWWAIDAAAVSEIVSKKTIHPVPHCSNPALAGIANIRGQLRYCMALEVLLGVVPDQLPQSSRRQPYERLLVVAIDGQEWGCWVHEVEGIKECDVTALQPPSTRYLKGSFEDEGRQVGYLDEAILFDRFKRGGR